MHKTLPPMFRYVLYGVIIINRGKHFITSLEIGKVSSGHVSAHGITELLLLSWMKLPVRYLLSKLTFPGMDSHSQYEMEISAVEIPPQKISSTENKQFSSIVQIHWNS